jgi:SHS2 domain-containing protein
MPMTAARWSHFSHEADIGVRGVGPTLAAALEQAACALFAAIIDLEAINESAVVTIACAAPDDRILLVDWLNALIYEATTRKMLFRRFVVRVVAGGLQGEAWGEWIDPARHHPAVEPKGATLTELKVEQAPDGRWLAQCVVDV